MEKTLEERIARLEAIEAIRMLQAKYQRSIDTHDFVSVGNCFTDDAVSEYDSGKMSYQGKDAIVEFLQNALTSKIASSHLIHGGEIDIIDSSHATGIWYLEDFLLHRVFLMKLHGTAIYHVEYKKIDNDWKISKIGYQRNYHYFERRPLINLFTLKSKR